MSLSIDVTDGMAFFLRSSLELWREGAHRLTQNQMVIVDKTNHKFRDVEPSLHLNKAEDETPLRNNQLRLLFDGVRHDDLFQLKLVVEVRRSQRFMFPRFTLLRMGRGASRLVPIVSRGDRELDGDARTGVASSWSWPSILLTPLIETRHRDRNRARRSIFFFWFKDSVFTHDKRNTKQRKANSCSPCRQGLRKAHNFEVLLSGEEELLIGTFEQKWARCRHLDEEKARSYDEEKLQTCCRWRRSSGL